MTTARTALLIADIGGYTDYMGAHRMTLAHAEVNTARMLESMIRAAPDFDLIEIEGDAAFLARRTIPAEPDGTLSNLLAVAVAMHRAFHDERAYVVANLCPCGGCRQARDLTLKFVAHVGDVATQSIRGRTKLVGIDVILVHRLLKNDVTIPEYVLLTDELFRTDETALGETRQEIAAELEGIGSIGAHFVDVGSLDAAPPPPRALGLGARLASTFSAVGRGLPYMTGRKRPRRDR